MILSLLGSTEVEPQRGLPQLEKASLENLEKDMQVTIYSDADVTTTDQLTAAYIEIVPLPPSNPAQSAE